MGVDSLERDLVTIPLHTVLPLSEPALVLAVSLIMCWSICKQCRTW